MVQSFPEKTMCRSTKDYWYDDYINYHVWSPTLTPYIEWGEDKEWNEQAEDVFINDTPCKPKGASSIKAQNYFDIPFGGQLFQNIYIKEEQDKELSKIIEKGYTFDLYMQDGWPFVKMFFKTKSETRN